VFKKLMLRFGYELVNGAYIKLNEHERMMVFEARRMLTQRHIETLPIGQGFLDPTNKWWWVVKDEEVRKLYVYTNCRNKLIAVLTMAGSELVY
jgi:hypothetical protein